VRGTRDEILAEEAEFDLRSRIGWLKQGRIFMAGPHVYVAGEHLTKHWGDVYTFKNAKITACDGAVPAWSLTAQEAVVEIDGYARLTRSSFQVNDRPVAYTPYFIFPVKTKRQTGLLRPEFGRSTTNGVFYNQPFFWAIDESRDLTVNEYLMEKRGFMHGMEYRAKPATDATVWLRGDWMWDKIRKLRQGDGEYAGDGQMRDNYDRYWLRGMIDARLPDPAWRFKADIDYVSDQYFLSEFKHDFSGFTRSRNELNSLFSRDLQEKSLKRQSGFLLTRDWERASVAFSSTYLQDQYLGNGNQPRSSDETVQRLPQFDAFLHKGRILPDLPLEIDSTLQAAYMYRRSGTRGARYEVVPTLTLPVNTRYGSIIASAGLTQTLYETELPSRSRDQGNNNNAPRQNNNSRTVPEFGIAGFTEFSRVFDLEPTPLDKTKENLGKSRWTALRHSIQPRLEFRHSANEDQERNPYYSPEDRLAPRTELVYSVTNALTVKQEHVALVKDPASGEMMPTLNTSYRDVLRLRLEQAYDQREATRDDERDVFPRRPFGDIFSDLTAYLTDYVSVSTRNNWSPYEGEFVRHQSGVRLHVPEYGSLYVGYDTRKAIQEYTRRSNHRVNYLRMDASTANFGPWSLHASYRQDYKNYSNQETYIDLTYTHQCFQLVGRVSIEPQETSYQLHIVLSGLGD
jgi:LPS-assembly protein